MKALCQERFVDWAKKFKSLNVKCFELTGDSELNSIAELEKTDIIITTPGMHLQIYYYYLTNNQEKWDSVTRKWKEMKSMMEHIAVPNRLAYIQSNFLACTD